MLFKKPPLFVPDLEQGGVLMKLINILIFVKGPPFAFRWLLYGICSKRKGSPLYISLNTGFGQNVKGPPFAFRWILYCFCSKRKGSPLCIFSKNIVHSKCKGSPLCDFGFGARARRRKLSCRLANRDFLPSGKCKGSPLCVLMVRPACLSISFFDVRPLVIPIFLPSTGRLTQSWFLSVNALTDTVCKCLMFEKTDLYVCWW